MLGSILLNYIKKVFILICSLLLLGFINSVIVMLFLWDIIWYVGYLIVFFKWLYNGMWKCGVWKVKGDVWSVNCEMWRVRVIMCIIFLDLFCF